MISDRDTGGRGYEMGLQGEALFQQTMEERGWIVEPSPVRENITEHWDFKITKGNHIYKVDVKAHKRVSRWDDAPDDKWVWLEIKNNAGYPGWLYATKADFIAFQRHDCFHFTSPESLRNWLEWRVDMNGDLVSSPKEAQYSLYQRKGRKDILTLVKYGEMPVRKTICGGMTNE
jgi:hypothetical protein